MTIDAWLDQTFCAGDDEIWDTNQLWNTSLPIVSRCLRKTIPIWTPAILLWFCAPLQVYQLWRDARHNRSYPIPHNLYNLTRSVFVGLLILVNLLHLGYDLITSFADSAYPNQNLTADLTSSLVNIGTFSLFLWLINLHRLTGHHTSALAWFFTLLHLTFSLPNIYMLTMYFWSRPTFDAHFQGSLEAFLILTECTLNGVLFLLTCFADTRLPILDQEETEEESTKPYPEQNASFLSKATYWWFNSTARLGFQKSLELEDLWDLLPTDKVKQMLATFERNWVQVADQSEAVPGAMTVIIRTFGPAYAFASIFQLLNIILLFISPQLLKQLIGFISKEDEPLWHGFVLAGALFTVATTNNLVFLHFIRSLHVLGTKLQNTLIAAIYKKSLKLSTSARRQATTGQIVNLMSSDAGQFRQLILYLDDLWSAPLQILLATYFLWNELGLSAFAGIAAMIALMPINWWITRIEGQAVKRQLTIKDERVGLMGEVLGAIRIVKLYAWEMPFMERITGIRSKETSQLKRISLLNALTSFVWDSAPFLVAFTTFAVYVLSSSSHVLDAQKAFISLSLFEIIRYPLGALPSCINKSIVTAASLKRLNRFFASDELEGYVRRDEAIEDGYDLVLEEACFSWGEEVEDEEQNNIEKSNLNLTSINLKIPGGSLVAIVGQVGCGKSSLLAALLGEMELKSGRVLLAPEATISYVAQQAWIQNTSLRQNILFGSEFDEKKYWDIVKMCALAPDLAVLPAGDLTEIGEKGINLSGGQKQRVALARACYANASIVVLDDVLSAVDAAVAKHLFTHVISSSSGCLKDRTRILVTNKIDILPEVDRIVVLEKGAISEMGSYEELMKRGGKFAEFLIEHEVTAAKDSVQELPKKPEIEAPDKDPPEDKLIEKEHAQEGSVKWSVYLRYFRSLTWFWLTVLLLLWITMNIVIVLNDLWLAVWSNDPPASPNTTESSITLRNKRLFVYGALGIGQNLLYFFGWIALALGSVNSSVTLHRQLLKSIMRSPMAFFDTTPLGRILNRFSKDLNTVDSNIRFSLEQSLFCFLRLVSLLLLIVYQIPLLILVILVLVLLYYLIQRYYIATYRQLSRLDSITSSPIFSHFAESLSGLTTIRAFAVQDRFIQQSNGKVDTNQRAFWAMIMAYRWMSLRMEALGNLIVLGTAVFAVLQKNSFQDQPGFVGLLVTYAISVNGQLKYLVKNCCDLESSIVAVERIGEYSQLKSEREWMRKENQNPKLPKSWPEGGSIQMEHYSVRYRAGLEPVLKDINVVIKGGEKVGVVGRTGSGKSTLTLALFRLLEADEGQITIDGVDISSIGLHELRSKLSIIPQDPVLFSGTIRSNLDPLSGHSDDQLWRALEQCHLKNLVVGLPSGLDSAIAEGGSNLSVGERQLICLGRALLRQTPILVLDEATSAVDLETDRLVQETIATCFAHCTILTIAHRLHTVLGADRILVLHEGAVVEFDSPQTLLSRPGSIFYSLAKDAGLV